MSDDAIIVVMRVLAYGSVHGVWDWRPKVSHLSAQRLHGWLNPRKQKIADRWEFSR